MTSLAALYGGYFALDTRLLGYVVVLSCLAAVGTVLGIKRLKKPRQMVLPCFLFFFGYLVLTLFVFNVIADYPVITLKSFFEIP